MPFFFFFFFSIKISYFYFFFFFFLFLSTLTGCSLRRVRGACAARRHKECAAVCFCCCSVSSISDHIKSSHSFSDRSSSRHSTSPARHPWQWQRRPAHATCSLLLAHPQCPV